MATQKRFEYYEHKGADYILDAPNKSLDFIEMLGDCLEAEEIVDLLNCLNDENEQLKIQLKIHKTDALETLNDLERAYENNKKALRNIEQLKGENKELRSDRDYWKTLAQSADENEQLKQRIKVLEDTVDGLTETIAHFDLDEAMWND